MHLGNLDQTTLSLSTMLLTEAIKRSFFDETPRWYPLVPIIISLGLGLFSGLTLFESIISGAAAAGIYDVTKKTIMDR